MLGFCRPLGRIILLSWFSWVAAAVADDDISPDTDSNDVLEFIEQMQAENESGQGWFDQIQDEPLGLDPALPPPSREKVLADIRLLTRTLSERHAFDSDLAAVQSLASIVAIHLIDGFLISGPVAHYLSAVIQHTWTPWGTPSAIGAYSGLSVAISYIILRNFKLIEDLSFTKNIQFVLESVGVGQIFGALGWYISNRYWATFLLKSPESLWNRVSFGHGVGNSFSFIDLHAYNSALHYILTNIGWTVAYYWCRSAREGSRLRGERNELEDELAKMQTILAELNQDDDYLISPEIDLETDYLPVPDHMHTD